MDRAGHPVPHQTEGVCGSTRRRRSCLQTPIPRAPRLFPGLSSLTAHSVEGASRLPLKTAAQLENPLATVHVSGSIHHSPSAPTSPSPSPTRTRLRTICHLSLRRGGRCRGLSEPRLRPALNTRAPLGASRVLIGCPAKGTPPLGSRIRVPPPGLFPRCDARRTPLRGRRSTEVRGGSEGFRRRNAERDEVTSLRWGPGKERAPGYPEAGASGFW